MRIPENKKHYVKPRAIYIVSESGKLLAGSPGDGPGGSGDADGGPSGGGAAKFAGGFDDDEDDYYNN